MRGTYRLKRIGARISETARTLPTIAQLARRPDHRREPVARKPVYRRFLDLGYINLRWGEVSTAYYSQGVDRVGRRVRNDYMPYPVFRAIRDSRNRSSGTGQPWDYVCLLQDKALFERYFGAAGLPVVPTVGEISPTRGLEFGGRSGRSFAELGAELGMPLALFCKPRYGIHGHDAFRIDVTEAGLTLNGEPIDEAALAERIREPYIAQRCITQHPQIACLHPESVNTVRIVTYRNGDEPEVLFASMKLGADGAVTDNGGATRCIVRVDADSGRFHDIGLWKGDHNLEEETTEHRQTGVCFRDCAVPFYDQCVEIARRAHAWLPGTYTVGWDFAVTPGGPLLLEGNDDWSGATSMNYPEIRARFLQAHGQQPPDTAAQA